jgi:hypothetical protein
MHSPILAPVVALVLWSLVVLAWVVLTRLPALKAAGIDLAKARGGRPGALDGVLPDGTQWKAHNYIHLMEQPTLFYAVCLTLALLGAGGGLNATLAWSYVALRVVHSLIQGTSNIIRYRFLAFALSTLVLIALTVHAALIVFR